MNLYPAQRRFLLLKLATAAGLNRIDQLLGRYAYSEIVPVICAAPSCLKTGQGKPGDQQKNCSACHQPTVHSASNELPVMSG
jgi:hypothetical protein